MKRVNNKKLFNIVMIFVIFLFSIILTGCGAQTNEIRVDGIEISKKNMYLAEGQTAVISAQVFPFNAQNQNYTFESSDDTIVTCEDGFVIAKKAGDAVISVYSEEGGYKDSCNVLVTKASDNLELNNYNNLNMPPKELKPIYNAENENVVKTNASETPLTLNKFKKYATSKINNELDDDINETKNVLNQIKNDFKLFFDDLKFEKSTLNSLYSYSKNSIFDAFNNIHLTILDELEKTNESMIEKIDNLSQKIDNGEYTVESKDINGVTFVVISNYKNDNQDI